MDGQIGKFIKKKVFKNRKIKIINTKEEKNIKKKRMPKRKDK